LNGVIMEGVRAVMEAQDIPEYLVTEIDAQQLKRRRHGSSSITNDLAWGISVF
jgi:hypothetical protein